MKTLRDKLRHFNMRLLAERAEVSYDILKNYSSGRKANLSEEEFSKIIKAIRELTI